MKAVILSLIIGICLWYVYTKKSEAVVYILIIEIEKGEMPIDSRLVSND